MKNQPLVSVILPTYNRERYIKRAIKSILSQTYQNFELIIVDDSSTDKTPELVSGFSKKDSRIRVVTNKINLGLVKTLNRGIRNARGKYIARLDDDDNWCDSKKLQKQVDFLEKNIEYALVGGGAIEVDKRGKEIMRYLLLENDEDIRKAILVDNAFAHVTVLFRKDIWEKVKGYDEKFDGLEDRDLWLKIGKLSKFYNFQEFFACYVGHDHKNPSYLIKNYGKTGQLKLNIKLRKKYSDDYVGYRKALLFCWANYFYSFLPFRQKLRPFGLKLRKIIFGPSVFK